MSDSWPLMQDFVAQAASAHARRDYGAVLDVSRRAMVWVSALAHEAAAEPWGKGLALRYPIFDHVIRLAPVALDSASLEYVRRAADGFSGLEPYRAEARSAIALQSRIASLYDSIQGAPGIVQAGLAVEWPYATTVLYCADAMGIVKRTKAGRSYGLEMLVDHMQRPLR